MFDAAKAFKRLSGRGCVRNVSESFSLAIYNDMTTAVGGRFSRCAWHDVHAALLDVVRK
jgi:hypothetical protein